jgi:hypothetical protein
MSIEERLAEVEDLLGQVMTAVMSLEEIVFNIPRRPCDCPECRARREEEKVTLQ